ncbi:MAG: hypothetical protein RLZZ543_1462, partial [Bacteroidota bacterium]
NSDTIDWNPTLNGNYNVRTTNQYGCVSISPPFTVNWVGIEDVAALMLQLAPNPADKIIFIQAQELLKNVGVYSVAGQLLKQFSMNNFTAQLSTEDLKEGLYFLRIETAKGVITKRLVVAH